MEFWTQILLACAIHAIAAIGLFLQIRSGQLNVGQAVFVGVGGYGAGLLALRAGLPAPLGMALATAMGFAAGAAFSALTLRLHHWFFAVTTLAMSIAAQSSVGRVEFLGGALGIDGVPLVHSAIPVLLVLLAAFGVALALERSAVGLAVRAVGDDQALAQAFGVGVRRLRVLMFATGAAMGAAAGALDVHRYGVYQPGDMGADASLMLFVYVIVGGKRSVWGPVVGTLALYVLPEFIQVAPQARMIIFGALLLASGVAMPDGLMGLAGVLTRRWRARARPAQTVEA